MKYDFLDSPSRENTNAEKYVLKKTLFKTDDVLPLWIADMDIDTPPFILDAVRLRLNHPIFGYEKFPTTAFLAQKEWVDKRYHFNFELDDMFYSHSVVSTMNLVIEAFSDVDDNVIVQTPVYPMFFKSILKHKRKIIYNPLKLDENGRYTFDIDDLNSKINDKTKLLFLCSPHNPVGRSWKREELHQILDVCLKNNIIVFSDEIHSDLVYEPNKHIPFASLNDEARNITITAMGTGKTFNMAGFAVSTVIITNKDLKDTFLEFYNKTYFADGTIFSHVAFESAYKNGEQWLDKLKQHLINNYKMLVETCSRYDDKIKVINIEATYLAWLDCRGMNMTNKQLKDFFVKEAKLGLGFGLSFGKEGSGFMRLNFAVSYNKMQEIIERLSIALKDRYDKN